MFENKGKPQDEAKKIYCDIKSSIPMAKNLVFHSRTKYIGIKYHFFREVEANEKIELKHYKIVEQLVHIFTKALPRAKLKVLRDMIGVIEIRSEDKY